MKKLKVKGIKLHDWKIWGYEPLKRDETSTNLVDLGRRIIRVGNPVVRYGKQAWSVLQRAIRKFRGRYGR